MKTFVRSTLVQGLAVVAFAAVAVQPASAQELKIGYVNSERVLRDSAPAKAAQAKKQAAPAAPAGKGK